MMNKRLKQLIQLRFFFGRIPRARCELLKTNVKKRDKVKSRVYFSLDFSSLSLETQWTQNVTI